MSSARPDPVTARPETLQRRHWLALGAILFVALVLRLGYLVPKLRDPAFEVIDPDHYLMGAQILARDGWHWTFRIVRYEYAGRFYFLPPLYPVFLSLFSPFGDTARAALVGQALLNVASVALLFDLGRRAHSTRAGLLAAAIYAVWFPNVIASWFYQEALYVPLVILAFLALSRALAAGTLVSFFLAGGAFGLAALSRTMPLYFVLPLGAARVVLAGLPRRRAALQSLAMILGFVVLVAPYSVALSRHVGRLTVVENHAGIELLSRDVRAGDGSPGLGETAASLARSMKRQRGHLVRDYYDSLRSVLYLNGGRLLQHYVVADSRTGAVVWKAAAHMFGDLAFAGALVLAPFGLVLARGREASLAAAIWILLNLALVALGGFAGARLRAPFEPHLILFAAVVLAGGFARTRRWWLTVAGAFACAGLAILAPQIPRTLRAWPDYGIRWQARPKGWRTRIRGRAGFNYRVRGGVVAIELRSPSGEAGNEADETVVEVRVDGEPVGRETLSRGERLELAYPRPDGTLAFVELETLSPVTREPRPLLVVARRPR
jgi:Dolichyl-phosphate-mannose-protein mannosyltransferase